MRSEAARAATAAASARDGQALLAAAAQIWAKVQTDLGVALGGSGQTRALSELEAAA